ncbi:MAG: hypothetical protein QOH71_4475 [Blastocatellia bacterium]|jgi:hypothetical protein|nr:hypothetical protein [Blastocatellia bacterium]
MKKFSLNGGSRVGRASHNGHAKEVELTLERLARESGDPELWRQKYDFYLKELQLLPEQARHWANGAVKASIEARVEFVLARERRLRVA